MRFSKTLLVCLSTLLLGGMAYAQTGNVAVSVYPTATVADGHSTLTITAHVAGSNGQPVADGTQVLFQTDLGSFREEIVTTQNGYARAILVAGSIPGTANIKIKPLGPPIAPQSADVEFVATKELLQNARRYIEVVSTSNVKYSPQDHLVTAEAADHGVHVHFHGSQLEADVVQINLDSNEIHALRAKLKTGKTEREFSELDIRYDNGKGQGRTNIKVAEPTNFVQSGLVFGFKTEEVERYTLVDISGTTITPNKAGYIRENFAIKSIEDEPATIVARKATIFPQKEIQFEKADLYVDNSRVMRMPLFKAPLNGSSPIFTDQMVNMNDNQLALSYPYYLSLKPGETSLLRFHMGDHTNTFGSGNGPQMDYQLDWNHGDAMEGGLIASGLGQQDWGVGLHQYYRLDEQTNMTAQLQLPAARSIFGNVNLNRQFQGYNLTANSSIDQTLNGTPISDQNTTLTLEKDPMRFGKLPFRFTYGLTASHQSTSADVPIKEEDNVGFQERFTMDPKRVDKFTTFNSSLAFTQFTGHNTGHAFGINGQLSLNKTLNRFSGVSFIYDYTQDPLADARLGAHHLSGRAFYERGNASVSLTGGTSLDINRIDYSATTSYQLAKLWRVSYLYTFDKFLGSSYLDYSYVVYYRLGVRDIGIVWSRQTNRLGIEILNAAIR